MDTLISAVSAANPSTVVVMQSGTPVAMPWISSVKALVHAVSTSLLHLVSILTISKWYSGNETGNVISDILFRKVNPSAKLPLSFPKRLQDNPAFLNYRTKRGRALCGEDVYVRYR
jgi:beta-glucosidase